jgi:cell division protein FtsN
MEQTKLSNKMNKVIKILAIALVTFFGYIWLGTIVKSCNSPKSEIGNIPEQDDYTPTTPPSSSDSYLPAEEYQTKIENDQSINDNTIDYKKIDDLLDNNKSTAPKSNSTENATKLPNAKSENQITSDPKIKELTIKNTEKSNDTAFPSNAARGKYKVVAGTFANKDNAIKLISQLKSIGFTQAEIVIFDNSVNHSVIACSYDDEKQANIAKQKIVNNGIAAFVSSKN